MTTPGETTLVGVMAPRVSVIAGVVVAVATEPDTPLAVTTDTLVTVPAGISLASRTLKMCFVPAANDSGVAPPLLLMTTVVRWKVFTPL